MTSTNTKKTRNAKVSVGLVTNGGGRDTSRPTSPSLVIMFHRLAQPLHLLKHNLFTYLLTLKRFWEPTLFDRWASIIICSISLSPEHKRWYDQP